MSRRCANGAPNAAKPAASLMPKVSASISDIAIRRTIYWERCLEFSKRDRRANRFTEAGEVLAPRNFHGSEAGGMFGDELNIEKLESFLLQPLHQVDQRNLGRIASACEH